MGDIDLKQRSFPAAFAKTYAIRVYGSEPSPNTWRNWREWAGISKGATMFSFEQVCTLAAIATIRSTDRVRQLRKSEILAIANSLELHEQIAAVIEFMDRADLVSGKDIVQALNVRGVEISLSTLYRRMREFNVKFSLQNVYPVDRLVTFLR